MEKSAFNRKTLFNRKLDINLRKKPIKCGIWNTPLTGAETWTLWKDQKYLKNFEIWCWRKVISWTSLVVYEVLRRVTKEKITLYTIKRTGRRRWMTRKKIKADIGWPSGQGRVLETEGGSTEPHCVENSHWERLLTCCKSDHGLDWCLMKVARGSLTVYRPRLDHASSVGL